jgi:hypothetical protein
MKITTDKRTIILMRNQEQSEEVAPCCLCKYWSGQTGYPSEWTREKDGLISSKILICAVRGCPQPTPDRLDKVNGELGYAWHNCDDFTPRYQFKQ